jgi:hypothetical protein
MRRCLGSLSSSTNSTENGGWLHIIR